MSTPARPGVLAIAALLTVPFFFASNSILGRATVDTVGPWTLAFLRWSLAGLMLLPLVWRAIAADGRALLARAPLFLALGFLGMIVSGGLFYTALRYTTATNASLLYTTSPLIILLLERIFRGRPIAWREVAGMLVASAGVAVIVTGGTLATLATMSFNPGDLLVVCCAASWAGYTVILRRRELAGLPVPVVFTAAALAGALLLAPFMAAETAASGRFPSTPAEWGAILGLALIASICAFLAYQFAVQKVGPSITGLTLYGMPIAGVGLAMLLLGERPGPAIFAGSALILGGVALATLPRDLLGRLVGR